MYLLSYSGPVFPLTNIDILPCSWTHRLIEMWIIFQTSWHFFSFWELGWLNWFIFWPFGQVGKLKLACVTGAWKSPLALIIPLYMADYFTFPCNLRNLTSGGESSLAVFPRTDNRDTEIVFLIVLLEFDNRCEGGLALIVDNSMHSFN